METWAVPLISTLGMLCWMGAFWAYRTDHVRAPLLLVILFEAFGYWTGSLTYNGWITSDQARISATTVRVVLLIAGAAYLVTAPRVRSWRRGA